MIIAIDFDGTIVEHEYPEIGKPIPNALECIKKILNKGHKIILFTMRCNNYLLEAINYLENNNIKLWGINENPEQKKWTISPKIYAHIYIDDANLGCPLIYNNIRPYVDWIKIEKLLKERNII